MIRKKRKIAIIGTGIIVCFLSTTHGQTIIVDPVTYEIKILDESTGKEIDSNNLGNTPTTEGGTSKEKLSNTSTTDQNDPTAPTQPDSDSKGETTKITNPQQQEFEKALSFMYENKMTIFNTSEKYQPRSFLTREQFAKIINRFYKISNYSDETKNKNCSFIDLHRSDPTLQEHILETCRLGIFKGYSDNTFRPFKQLTKAEFITVLMRIYTKKMGNENLSPRRISYYNSAKELGIIEDKVDTMDNPLDRQSAAIYMRRVYNKKEQSNNNTDNVTNNKDINISSNTNTENIETKSNILKNISILGEEINPQNDPQLKEAIHTMYENKMITHDRANTNFLYTNTTREEVAKILDIYGNKYIKDYPNKKNEKNVSCIFNDVGINDENYEYINNVCKMGIMLGDNENNFLPKDPILKSQFITALVRLIEGKLNENTIPRWQGYFDKAKERGIINQEDKDGFEKTISNIEMILYLHRLIINNIIAQNLDYTPTSNEFMIIKNHKQPDQIQTYIDVNFLRTLDNKVGYINREENQRKVQKTDIQEYPNFHIVRYGEIHDTVSNDTLGSVMFITDKKHLLNGIIRLNKEKIVYTIQPLETNPFEYTVLEQNR